MPVGVGAKPAGGAAGAGKPGPPPAAPPAGAAPEKGKSKLVLILVLVIVILLLAAGGFVVYTMFLSGGAGSDEGQPVATKEETAAKHIGKLAVSTGDAMNINLADGKILVFGATVYFDDTVEAGEGSEVDNSPARDAAFKLFTNMKLKDLETPHAQEEMKKKYLALLNKEDLEPYHGHVAAVKFTQWTHT